MDDTELIAALEANGHQDAADKLKSERLAESLAATGRADLAALMAEPPAPAAEKNEDEAFVEQLRTALKGNSVSLPGLLDE